METYDNNYYCLWRCMRLIT
jgi:hypothetical protein